MIGTIEHKLTLDTGKAGVQARITARQGDSLVHLIRIRLDCGIPAGVKTAQIMGTLPGGGTVYADGEIKKGECVFIPGAGFFSEGGAVICRLLLCGADGAELCSPAFAIDAEPSSCYGGGAVPAEEYSRLAALVKLVGELQKKCDGILTPESAASLRSELVEMISDAGGDRLPAYAAAERDAVRDELYDKTALGNVAIIGFSTDQHISRWEDMESATNTTGTLAGLRALGSLTRMIPFNVICLGGDYCSSTSVAGIQEEVLTVFEQLADADCPVIGVTGNHDAWQNTTAVTSADIFKSHFAAAVTNCHRLVNLDTISTNGYIDDPTVSIRYVFVDSDPHHEYVNADIRTALATMLEGVPDGYKAIVFSHKPMSGVLGTDWHNGWSNQDILALHKDKLICCINGHSHLDSSAVSDGILYIQTKAASPTDYNGNGDYSCVGTADETAFDVFAVDQENSMIYAVRYGGGESRTFKIPDGSEDSGDSGDSGLPDADSVTNRIPLSVDTDGSVYNGTGFMDGKRINSSGAVVDADGYAVTGFIPFSNGDTLYGSADIFTPGTGESDTGYNSIAGYDASFNFIGNNYAADADTITMNDDGSWAFDPSNHSAYANVAFVRICGIGLSSASVATVNEPFKSDSVSGGTESGGSGDDSGSGESGGNLIPTSVDTDGSVYNGTGFMDGKRINSSGAVVDADGYAVTGFIPFKNGDTLYGSADIFTPGTGESDTGYNSIAGYDASFNFIGNNYAASADTITMNDDGTWAFDPSIHSSYAGVAFVRICGIGLSAASVATVNEPLS